MIWDLVREILDQLFPSLIKWIFTGKTVQMIATMAMNLPRSDEAKSTLIVVPAALLEQVCPFPHLC
jgi:hypothetical protein